MISNIPSNKLQGIEARNDAAMAAIEHFRADMGKGAASRQDFAKLKHAHPFVGFVACRAAGIDFLMFHVNDDVVAWEYLWFGEDGYESDIIREWVKRSRNASIVYDIGAYTGLMSILAGLASPKTHVHLFEPIERTIERAKINIRLNSLGQRVKLHNVAASDEDAIEKINLYREENFLGTGNSIHDKGLPVIGSKLISCVRIDDFLPDGKPDLVKIDVEGHELACLNGMKKTIEANRPVMIVEVWEHTRNDVLALLKSMNYRCNAFEKHETKVMNFLCEPN